MTGQELLNPNRIPTREGVLRAAAKIAAILPPTPLLTLEVDGRTIWCKAECLQPIGAFKIRGGGIPHKRAPGSNLQRTSVVSLSDSADR